MVMVRLLRFVLDDEISVLKFYQRRRMLHEGFYKELMDTLALRSAFVFGLRDSFTGGETRKR